MEDEVTDGTKKSEEVLEKPVKTSRHNNSGLFVKNDPRRINRQLGSINDTTRAAQALLRERALPLVEKMLKMTEPTREDGESCPMCGRGALRPEETQLKALQSALDRGGMGPSTRVEVTEKPDTEWMHYLTDEQLNTLDAWVDEAKQRMLSAPGENGS